MSHMNAVVSKTFSLMLPLRLNNDESVHYFSRAAHIPDPFTKFVMVDVVFVITVTDFSP